MCHNKCSELRRMSGKNNKFWLIKIQWGKVKFSICTAALIELRWFGIKKYCKSNWNFGTSLFKDLQNWMDCLPCIILKGERHEYGSLPGKCLTWEQKIKSSKIQKCRAFFGLREPKCGLSFLVAHCTQIKQLSLVSLAELKPHWHLGTSGRQGRLPAQGLGKFGSDRYWLSMGYQEFAGKVLLCPKSLPLGHEVFQNLNSSRWTKLPVRVGGGNKDTYPGRCKQTFYSSSNIRGD